MSRFWTNPPGLATRLRFRRLLLASATAALLSVLGMGPAAAQAQPQDDQGRPVVNPQARAADLTRPAVVWIRIHYDAWVRTGVDARPDPVPLDYGCSGFIVNPNGYIVTAGHCIDDGMDGAQGDAIEIEVDRMVQNGLLPASQREAYIQAVLEGAVPWKVEGYYGNSRPDRTVSVTVGGGDVRWRQKITANARVVQFLPWDQGDVALLKIQKTGLPSMLLSPTDDIQVGEQLLSIGYPGAAVVDDGDQLAVTNRNGQINAERTKGPNNLPFYETSAALTPGMSGGPTVDLDSQVVGLASFKSEDANFIVPSSIIQELLSRNGVKNELGRLDQLYRQGLENYYRGAYSAAIKSFDEVLALMPQHKLAAAKKAKAAELRERFGDPPPPAAPAKRGRSAIGMLVAVAAALVLVSATAGLAVWRTRRRRGGRAAPDAAVLTDASSGSTAGLRSDPLGRPLGNGHGDSSEHLEAAIDRPAARHGEINAHYTAVAGADRLGEPSHDEATVGAGARTVTSLSTPTPGAPASPQAAAGTGPTRRFCFACGAPVQPEDPVCQRCGTELT
jgi:serine protease Do